MKLNTHSKRLLMIVSGIALLSACEVQQDASEEPEVATKDEPEVVAVPVEVSKVTKGDIAAVYTNTTSLESEQQATVVAKVSEIITEIMVEEGDTVVAGQPLLRLNTDKLQLEVARAEVNLQRLKAELERNRLMFEQQMVSSEVFERMKFDYKAQVADFELAKLELKNATIIAPIDGVVSKRMVKVGNMLKVNDPVFEISDFDPLVAIVHVPEREMFKLAPGQAAQFMVDALQGEAFAGLIDRISPVVDSESGTFKVTIKVNDPNQRLKPGLFGRVGVIYANHQDSLLIDKNALVADATSPSVYVVQDGKAQLTAIETGFTNTANIEVTGGLSQGDLVVVAGKNSLKNDTPVDILNTEVAEEIELEVDDLEKNESDNIRRTAKR